MGHGRLRAQFRFDSGSPANSARPILHYEGEAFLQCPTTTDHNSLIRLFEEANSGKVKGGTAIGAGLATALNTIQESKSRIQNYKYSHFNPLRIIFAGTNKAKSQSKRIV